MAARSCCETTLVGIGVFNGWQKVMERVLDAQETLLVDIENALKQISKYEDQVKNVIDVNVHCTLSEMVSLVVEKELNAQVVLAKRDMVDTQNALSAMESKVCYLKKEEMELIDFHQQEKKMWQMQDEIDEINHCENERLKNSVLKLEKEMVDKESEIELVKGDLRDREMEMNKVEIKLNDMVQALKCREMELEEVKREMKQREMNQLEKIRQHADEMDFQKKEWMERIKHSERMERSKNSELMEKSKYSERIKNVDGEPLYHKYILRLGKAVQSKSDKIKLAKGLLAKSQCPMAREAMQVLLETTAP